MTQLDMTRLDMTRFAIIGFGEVGSIFARDLAAAGTRLALPHSISVFDIAAAALERARKTPVVAVASSAAEAARNADIIIVAVTAGSTLDALASLKGGLDHAPLVLDINSVAPATKQAGERIITEAGGRYVEAAVMTSVPPKGFASPMLLGGPHAEDIVRLLQPYGGAMTPFGPVGRASSVKMSRSIMIKGLEAITTECLATARYYGVENDVLATLADTLPHADWAKLARYMISRSLIHGKRRAEEMREVEKTVADTKLTPIMAPAITERQERSGRIGSVLGHATIDTLDLPSLLDQLTAIDIAQP